MRKVVTRRGIGACFVMSNYTVVVSNTFVHRQKRGETLRDLLDGNSDVGGAPALGAGDQRPHTPHP